MKRLLGLLSLVMVALPSLTQAACTNSVATGITLTMGTTQDLQVNAMVGCVPQNLSGLTISGTGLGSIYNESAVNTQIFRLTPLAIGSGNISFAGAGFSTLTVPVTVNAGTLDVVTAP